MTQPIFNLGNPAHSQCAQRDDGTWFIRDKRTDAPGWHGWRLAPFTNRPRHAWYSGRKARLPKWKPSGNASGV